jgi:hypothetical protein
VEGEGEGESLGRAAERRAASCCCWWSPCIIYLFIYFVDLLLHLYGMAWEWILIRFAASPSLLLSSALVHKRKDGFYWINLTFLHYEKIDLALLIKSRRSKKSKWEKPLINITK